MKPSDRPSGSLVDLFEQVTHERAASPAFTFLEDDASLPARSLSYGELGQQARRIAAHLQQITDKGDRVLLVHAPGLDYIVAFFACVYAGVIAVPALPPTHVRQLPRLQLIARNAQARVVLSSQAIRERMAQLDAKAGPGHRRLNPIATDALPEPQEAWRDPGCGPDDLAFLQYTSGSTGAPKGVMVSHRNILANLAHIHLAVPLVPGECMVSWLPPYHDMGLIGKIIFPFFAQCHAVHMAPAAFIANPSRWLQAISNYRGRATSAPNFAYELCVEKLGDRHKATLDLRSLDFALSGAEPVRQATLERFVEAFAGCGFSVRAVRPVYGLAEATLFATGAGPTEGGALRPALRLSREALSLDRIEDPSGQADALTLVSVGRSPGDAHALAIVDPHTRDRLGENRVGEIWFSGPSVAGGYWNQPEESAAVFGHAPRGEEAQDARYMRTGDLGLLRGGELYVCGRIKDLVIVNGRNIHPQDIEDASCASEPRVRRNNGAAAFSMDGATGEQLVVVQELERRQVAHPRIYEAIVAAVSARTGLPPDIIVLIKQGTLPRTSSGKVRRSQCRADLLADRLAVLGRWERNEAALPLLPSAAPAPQPAVTVTGVREVQAQLLAVLAAKLSVAAEAIDPAREFAALGLTSIHSIELAGQLADMFGIEVPPTVFWEHPTIAQLAAHLARERGPAAPASAESSSTRPETAAAADEPIAIIGMACRFPGADSEEAFWQSLLGGVDAIRPAPAARLAAGTFTPAAEGPAHAFSAGFLDAVDGFDATFFGISPAEAARLDPQQRLLLEVSWHALEDAGIAPASLAGSATGAFIGLSTHDYESLQSYGGGSADIYVATGNAASIAANRLSYALDLRGPSLVIDTACSSSLVALHVACQSLRAGESRCAIVGGANLILSGGTSLPFANAGMLSPQARCGSFDAAADGYVRGEGCGVVILKPLSAARRDGDRIRALVRGSAVAQDGRSNGLLAPTGAAQQAVIRQALANARVEPTRIGYLETHGTGTVLGDPIELDALKAVFANDAGRAEDCLLGALKTHIGHLEAAAGIAGLIKTVRVLEHGRIPANLHFSVPNPHSALAGSGLAVAAASTDWPAREGGRHAGVSSFGFGGTVAHVVLSQAPDAEALVQPAAPVPALLTLSAKTQTALDGLSQALCAHLRAHPQTSLADVACTLQTGRDAMPHRRSLVCRDVQEACAALSGGEGAPKSFERRGGSMLAAPVFLFPGQGAQGWRMAHALYLAIPSFRRDLDHCHTVLQREGLDLLGVLFEGDPATAEATLQRTEWAQPALFCVEYCLAQLLIRWGLRPSAMLGHSVGEYVAACIAGVFALDDALGLIAARGRLMQRMPTGAMLSVRLDPSVLQPYLQGSIALAAVNAPGRSVLAGPFEEIDAVELQLTERQVPLQRLNTSHAFHSSLMQPAAREFAQRVAAVPRRAPSLRFLSNLSGTWITEAQAVDPEYWAQHLLQPVLFSAGLSQLAQEDEAGQERLFLEVGPGTALGGFVRTFERATLPGAGDSPRWQALATLSRGAQPQADLLALLETLGRCWIAGQSVDWQAFHAEHAPRRIALPAYPFDRQRHWVAPSATATEIRPAMTERITLPVPNSPPPTRVPQARDRLIATQIQELVGALLQLEPAQVDVHARMLELGADSLVLVQAVRTIEQRYGVTLTIKQMFEELTSIAEIGRYLDAQLPAGWGEAPAAEVVQAVAPQATPDAPSLPANDATSIERLMALQMQTMSQLMNRQLETLSGSAPRAAAPVSAPTPARAPAPLAPAAALNAPVPFNPYKRVQAAEGDALAGMTPRQRQYHEAFVARYTQRTRRSREMAQQYRGVLSDNRNTAGFRFSVKELLYPIVSSHSEGARIWDLDGNEYVDLTMGFGVNFFGHRAPFIESEVEAQLRQGTSLGPQTPLAGEVAGLITQLTGMERVTFCNSGTEAVMLALRLARARTGRRRIASFNGSFHGWSDDTLAVQDPVDKRISAPMAPGVQAGTTDQTLVLDYGSPDALETIRLHAHELAAVIVEPVQSRRPDFLPREFLHELRALTQAHGIALVFDEMISGFRFHPGGVQALVGVRADIATYGKMIGGGLPIGIVAGSGAFLDGVDGGFWQYGDMSYPKETTTFFAGTFCKHPLTLAASRACLRRMVEEGPALQERVTALTARLIDGLNRLFQARHVPVQAVHFGSLIRLYLRGNLDLLFYQLISRGVYIWEGRNMFLSTSHTEADVDFVLGAFALAIDDLRSGGFLPELPPDGDGPSGGARDDTVSDVTAAIVAPAARAAATLRNAQAEALLAIDTAAKASRAAPAPSYDMAADAFALTPTQRGIWLECEVDVSASLGYHVNTAVRLRGALELALFEQAFERVAQRHDAFRLRFVEDEEEVRQVVEGRAPPLEQVDLSAAADPAQALSQWMAGNNRMPFDVRRGPLWRAVLLRLDPLQHVVVLTAHHVVSDGISQSQVVAELVQAYDALCAGTQATWPAATGLRAYAAGRTAYARGPRFEADRRYWCEVFAEPVPPILLPGKKTPGARAEYVAAQQRLVIDGARYARLLKLGNDHGCTLFMTMFAVVGALLQRLMLQDDMVIGVPFAVGRPELGEGELVGCTVNVVPVRCRPRAGLAFGDYLREVRGRIVEVHAHSEFPFGELVRALDLPVDPMHRQLAPVLFNLNRAPQLPRLRGLEAELLDHPVDFGVNDFLIDGLQLQGELVLSFQYRKDLYDETAIARLMADCRRLIDIVTADPGMAIGDIGLIDAQERQRILVAWNDTAMPLPDTTLPGLFEAQAARTPDAAAAVFGETSLTYAQLDARANRLANHLVALGVVPDGRVALCVERSLDMAIGLLAILKAGAAYVPLDASLPAERLRFMMADAQPAVLLTQSAVHARLPDAACAVAYIDALDLRHLPDAKPQVAMHPDQLSYVIYTSGSTGRPKGICLPHRALINLLEWSRLHLPKPQRALAYASLGFDASFYELFTSWQVGGCVHIVEEALRTDLHALAGYLARHRIEAATLPVVVLQSLAHAAAHEGGTDLGALRFIIATGEALVLTPEIVQLLQADPRRQLHNHYGPSETHVVTAHTLRLPEDAQPGVPPPIGGPIANSRMYVLDGRLQPVPVEVTGELYIAGDSLARGYLDRPGLTAERFLPDPHGAPGSRMYRTGDLAKWRAGAEGVLDFLGRADHQVKVRGFRVELGEVETTLARLPGVAQASVIAREDAGGRTQLVGYVVAEDAGAPLDAGALRQALGATLPDYMVPAAIVVLPALPLTPNGKLDRRALPAPAFSRIGRAPRTPHEEILAGVFADLLGLERVFIDDSFFDLGGQSLLATQLVSRLRHALRVELPLRVLFDAPSVAQLAAHVEGLVRTEPLPPVERADRGQPLPLSFAQQRLWFLDQLEPGSAFYNMPGGVRLSGALDVDALTRALNGLLRRHEALRTRFASHEAQAVQLIDASLELELPLTDLRALPAWAREAQAQALTEQEAAAPFDLARGPLVRARLLRLAHDEHLLLLTLHHIVCDGWSIGVLVREIAALYEAFSQGRDSPLSALPIQYADYAAWQRRFLAGETLARQLGHWREQLAGAPTLLELPTDRSRPAVQRHRGAVQGFVVPAQTTAALHRLGGSAQATLFMTLSAAFSVLLARHARQNDVCLGTPIANRTRAELEGLIGFFVNTLVLRTRIEPAQVFLDLLKQVRDTTLAAYANQDLPFEQLVDELEPERHLSQAPLFQVMLALQNTPAESLSLGGLQIERIVSAAAIAKFDLTLEVVEEGGQLHCGFEYDTDLFDASRIECMARQFVHLLREVTASPLTRVGDLTLLEEAERERLLVGWNATQARAPLALGVHELFEAQAVRAPDAAAVVFGDRSLSYAALESRANQIARCLRELGVGPEHRVGLCVERGLDMAIGLLAILKTGAAYVPLDAAYPSERIATMLDDAQPSAVLTQSPLSGSLSRARERPGVRVSPIPLLYLDDASLGSEQSTEPLPSSSRPDQLAYVIYTSGSTGRPKGIGLPHLALLNLLEWARLAQPKPERALAFASLSFDASFYEFFTSWHTGGCVFIADEPLRTDVAALGRYIAEQRLQAATLPVVVLQALAHESLDLSSLTEIIATGEALVMTPEIVRFLQQVPDRHLYNHYGPSETHVVTAYTLRDKDHSLTVPPSIGRPIANSRIYLLDERMQPVPQGVAGELFIAGDNLARGYLGRPDLTAERFIPDPFGQSGDRMYSSGDLARYLNDGRIEFLGRIDHQVKIRGFRIEPGEVETALLALPNVREAVVLAREDRPGDKRLVAYVVSDQDDTAQWRTGLESTLPHYMVPTHFVALPSLPLTGNGKIDRRALPAPDHTDTGAEFIAPRTATEQSLADIWCEVLAIEAPGVQDNFFALGGNSLLATQLVSRVRTRLSVELPLRALFEAPTIAQLAERVEALAPEETLSAIEPADRSAPLPLSFAQQRLWFLDQFEPGQTIYNMPGGVRLSGTLDVSALTLALNELVRRHEVLRTHFASKDDQAVQVVAPQIDLALPLTDLGALPAEERDAQAHALEEQEAATPFDLASGPLLRARLLRLADDEHLLLLTLHHIVCDGWSIGVLVREIAALYMAFSQGKPSPLSPLPVQYADFAAWQRRSLAGETLERQLAHWRDQLAGAPTLLELPTDRPRPATQSHRGAVHAFVVAEGTTTSLNALAMRTRATLFMTLAAAFSLLLSRHARQNDICLGTPIANRTRAELEGLIGFFVNTLVLRTRIDPRQSFQQLMEQVKTTTLSAYANQDLPFEQLVDELKPERHLSHAPLFQVMLALHNTPADALSLGGLRIERTAPANTVAKFDLTLEVVASGGELYCSFEYDTALFDASTIARMAGHLQTLLGGIGRSPEAPVETLALLTAPERVELARWSRTQPHPESDTLLSRFERPATLHAHRTALRCDGQSLSYAELDARANRIAHRLRRLGVGPDVLVGLCIERSIDLVVGLLAILKAGGAYLPLDPGNPPQRRADILADARPAALLTQSHLRADLHPQDEACAVLCIDTESFDAEPTGAPISQVGTDHLAYVIYTSGSTGRPKGTLLTHRNVLRLFDATQPWFDFGADDVWTLFHSCAFDFSVWELWGALLHGGRLVVVPHAVSRSPAQFHELVRREGVTVLNQTPSAFLQFAAVDLMQPAQPLPLRTVIFGGEALNRQALAPWFERHGHASPRLVNMYGITETTVHVTYAPLVEGARQSALSIGLPIPDLAVHLLDPSGQPVPVGVAGELHIAGDGLARGYLNQPALTATRFVPDPFGPPGGRLYASGDLAHRRSDGSLEYLGRIDHQVKVRGFRIELGEIEAALAAQAGVAENLVVAREDTPGDTRLVAYVVMEPGAAASGLRQALALSLPDYMLPARFVELAAMPLTVNGKIDRQALPVPDSAHEDAGDGAPRTPAEEILAGIWAAVLGLDKVGIHDDFFALGGHSLLATQMVSKTRDVLRIDLPLRTLFETPTIAQLSPLLQARQEEALPPIEPVARDAGVALPLSFSQQRLWFLDQWQPGRAAFNIPAAVRLSGPIDLDAMTRTLCEIVRRHEALRTRFVAVNGEAAQQIDAPPALILPVTDLRAWPVAERETAAQTLLREEARTPFDLAHGPVLRAGVLQLDDAVAILYLTLHHIVADGWAMGVLIEEIAALYAAFAEGRPSPLPELPVQYADYAAWQHRWLSDGPVRERLLGYWRARLEGAPTLLSLPTDRSRPAVQTHRGAVVPFALPRETSDALRVLARDTQSTLFMVLSAAFSVLLSRHARQEDICLGTVIANRNRSETEGLIGVFFNTLVLRSHVAGDMRFDALLQQVRRNALDAYVHQDLPFEHLLDAVKPSRHTSHSPLFQVMLILQNAPRTQLTLPGIEAESFLIEEPHAPVDIKLTVSEADAEIGGTFEYDTALFDATTIERMAGQFARLLREVTLSPSSLVCDLPLLGEEERERVLVEWNSTRADAPLALGVHELFEAQAVRAPDAAAVVFGDRSLSYAALESRANQIARCLRELGVGPEHRVGLCVERGLDMAIGLLAILKTGAAYVPLDAAYPSERIATMLDDAQPSAVLTQSPLSGSLSRARERPGVRVSPIPLLYLDDASLGSEQSTEPLPSSSRPDQLAYVIYTSGSTGRPKGIGLPHLALLNLLEWARLAQPKPERALAFASLSFDASFYEFFTSWHTGGCVFIADEPLRTDVAALGRYIAEQRLQAATLPVVVLQALAHESLDLSSLTEIIATGEALVMTPEIVRFLQQVPDRHLYNHYGPSETHVVTAYTLRDKDHSLTVPPSIGRPIANSRIYLLDERMQPVPQGVAGELFIAGDNLARGYLGRPDLTAERFIPDPFGQSGDRMYSSGDLARYLNDGRIEFLGRIDHQVKIRGFRIEPGEVETALLALPNVREAVVLAREDRPGDKRLVAYVVSDQDDTAQWRTGLESTLPHYMVPTHFVALPSLPLTGNGKIDRRALPAPDHTDTGAEFIAPRTATEQSLADIWCEVLAIEAPGVQDNFFALGGNSLLATQLVSRVRTRLSVELPLRALFEAPTIAQLAERVEALAPEETLSAIEPADRSAPLPLSFAQQRLWFLSQMEGVSQAYHLPLGLRLHGTLDRGALIASLAAIVARHESLRTTFATVDGEPVQHIAPPDAGFRLVCGDLRAEADPQSALQRLAEEEATAPFDLAVGPLARGRLIVLGDGEHVLLVTLHHIVSDGWSMGLLAQEFGALYRAFSQGEPDPLPPLAVQYPDYAAWQRRWLQGPVREVQTAYWTQALADAPVAIALQGDRPRPAQQDLRGAAIPLALPPALVPALDALAQRHGATLFMTLLAGWSVLLARLSGQDDIVVGAPVANRRRAEIEPLIGFFVNTLALRTDLSGRPTVAQLLMRVRDRSLEAQQHQDLPFESVVDALRPPRSLAHTPLFQVMFAWQNQQSIALELPGLALSAVETPHTSAMFELGLNLAQNEGRIEGTLEYATARFDRATAERYAAALLRILQAMAEDDSVEVHRLPWLSDAERECVLYDWNATDAADGAHERCIHELFEAQARHAPDATALVHGDLVFSYGELDSRADRLARRLRRLDAVAPDARIAICAARGIPMVVGLLAVLKAGAAYVPLDPAHPPQRLLDMLADSGAVAWLTDGSVVLDAPVAAIDLRDDDGSDDAQAPVSAATPAHLAYVMYTSGSTGRPKGVMIEHRALCNQVLALQQRYGLDRGDRVLQFASFTFDMSVEEIFGALCSGAALVLRTDAWMENAGAFLSHCRTHGVTVANLPPIFWQHLLQEGGEWPACLRQVMIGGDSVSPGAVRDWFARAGHRPRLINAYGPTEATVNATVHELAGGDELCIGRPLRNTRVYLLDANDAPVPVGVAGELCIGGAGIARGYLNQPELSAQRFVCDPFAAARGAVDARMYRTGDLARWRADGRIEFLGRNDFQVKLRGIRIEPGEIEACLLTHPGLAAAVVVAREDRVGVPRLVAYCVAAGEAPDVAALRTHLANALPAAMVPAAFVMLPALPTTPNGKLERRALPAPDDEAYLAHGYEAPQGEVEAEVARIWAEVLGLERVGRGDDFFDLGGHSLMATRIVSRVHAAFDVALPLGLLFEQPTVAVIASHIEAEILAQIENLSEQDALALLQRVSPVDAALIASATETDPAP